MKNQININGVINIYKEKGFTSHDVVAKMRGILKIKKIGHTGTLDPDAEGVLPICVGNATKLCDLIMEKDKEYVAELVLGKKTTTEDLSGDIVSTSEAYKKITMEELKNIVKTFEGEIMQVPPMFSAIKVNGKKLYELARAGVEVERKARKINIYRIEILDELKETDNDLRVHIKVACSKGTYIRTLCNDIGEKLGCFGCMGSLIRNKSGQFVIEESIKLAELAEIVADNGLENSGKLIKVDEILDYESLNLKPEYKKLLNNGNHLYTEAFEENDIKYVNDALFKIYDEGYFKAVYRFDEKSNLFKAEKMFG